MPNINFFKRDKENCFKWFKLNKDVNVKFKFVKLSF